MPRLTFTTASLRRRLQPHTPAPRGTPLTPREFAAYIERRREIRHLSDLAARAISMPRGLSLVLYQCTSGQCGRCHFCKWPQSISVCFR